MLEDIELVLQIKLNLRKEGSLCFIHLFCGYLSTHQDPLSFKNCPTFFMDQKIKAHRGRDKMPYLSSHSQ